ncbi:hypothetical protein Tco_1305720, partial [Tanacetum coccineum]
FSWCGGPFNGGNCQHCTNVSFGDEFVRNPDPIANDETPNFSYPPSQPQTSSLDQFSCFHCGDPLEDGVRCQRCTYGRCGYYLREGFCSFCNSEAVNSFVYDSNPNSFNDPPNVFTHPPQPQYESYSCELCGNDSHYGYDCPPWFSLYTIDHQPQEDLNQQSMDDVYSKWDNMIESRNEHLQSLGEMLCQREQAANLSTHTPEPSIGNLVPNPSESEDTSNNDSECDLPSSVTFYNPLFDLNDDFTSSDDNSLSNEDVLEDNIKIYSNPLFEFDDEYISSDVKLLFDEVLEDIESKDAYVSNLDDPALLVTPLSDANEDECFDPGGEIDEIDAFLDMDISTDIKNGYHDSEGDIIYFESFLIDDTILNLPPEVFFFLISPIWRILLFLYPSGVRISFLTPASSLIVSIP